MWKNQFRVGDVKLTMDENRVIVNLSNYETEEILIYAIYIWIERFIEIIENCSIIKSNYKFINREEIEFKFLF